MLCIGCRQNLDPVTAHLHRCPSISDTGAVAHPAPERYTKDLEDMLERTITALEFVEMDEDLIAEAKALLERTGYTEDF